MRIVTPKKIWNDQIKRIFTLVFFHLAINELIIEKTQNMFT